MKMFGLLAISFGLLLLSARVQATDVSAEHGNDMVHVGKSIDVAASEAVGDAVCVGCSIHIAGRASGDLVAVGGSVQVEGTVQGDAVVVGGNLRLEPGAVIHGDVSVVGGRLQRDPAARIDGEVSTPSLHGGAGALVLVLLVPLLAMLLIGILLVVLCVAVLGEGRIEIVVEALRRHTGLGLLAGLGVIVGFLVLISVFHWTGPLSPIVSVGLFLALLAMAVVGYSGVSAWVGHNLAPSAGVMGAAVAGAVLVGVLQAIPLLGMFAVVMFGLLALGAAALTGLGTSPDWLAKRLANHPAPPPARAAGGR